MASRHEETQDGQTCEGEKQAHTKPAFFWTRSEGPQTDPPQRHHGTAMGKPVTTFAIMTTQRKTTGNLLSLKQTTSVRATVTTGNRRTSTSVPSVSKTPITIRRDSTPPPLALEGLPRQCARVPTSDAIDAIGHRSPQPSNRRRSTASPLCDAKHLFHHQFSPPVQTSGYH